MGILYSVRSDRGKPLRATLHIEGHSIVMHSAGDGGNPDYTAALELIIRRLFAAGMPIVAARIVSRDAYVSSLPEADRTIIGADDRGLSAADTIARLTRNMRTMARRAGAKGGGNPQRRIRLELETQVSEQRIVDAIDAVAKSPRVVDPDAGSSRLGHVRMSPDSRCYLLTWNPKNYDWRDLPDQVRSLGAGVRLVLKWSCGNTKRVPAGARVFLLRQGVEPKGIVASGYVTEPTFEDSHWDVSRAARGDKARYIRFAVDSLLDPYGTPPLRIDESSPLPLGELAINVGSSGTLIPSHVAEALTLAWTGHASQRGTLWVPMDPEVSALEGEQRRRYTIHRTREWSLRDARIEQAKRSHPEGRLCCEVPGCGFDFERRYGALGKDYAQVHHKLPLAETNELVRTRLDDLAVVCANCHQMIHRGGLCRPLEGLIAANGAGRDVADTAVSDAEH